MNKLKGIILVVSICFASIMMPFNIYADTISQSNIIGVNTTLISREISQGVNGGYIYIYNYENEITLDNNYIGWLQGNINIVYHMTSNSDGTWNDTNISRSVRSFVNGNKVKINVSLLSSINQQGVGIYVSSSYLLTSSDVTKYEDIDSITQIINILEDLYTNSNDIEGLETNQLTTLQNILLSLNNANLKLDDVNTYLDTIYKMRNYNVPIESLGLVSYAVNKLNNRIFDNYTNGYYIYPVFNVQTNDILFDISTYQNIDSYLVIMCRYINISNINSIIEISNGTISSVDQIPNITYRTLGYQIQCYKIKFHATSSSNVIFKSLVNMGYIPISFSVDGRANFSTDFALLYGFSNPLIDNLNTIANGTTASNNASQQLDSDTSDFNTDRDDLIDIEDSMGNNMDSAMNQIQPNNNGLSGFGGNFLTSAVWVRTQFERLTNNTPYGSLIVYGMTLGLALLLLGKVML